MQGAGAPGGQGRAPSRPGALSRPRVLLLTYLLTTLDLTCLFMQFSVLPYLSRRLGLDSVAFGYLQTVFGALQLLSGPMFGRFADQRGARAALTASFLAGSALYLLLAAACSPSLPGTALLFASRLPALLLHTLPAAQMVVADLSAPAERPAALGRLGLCFGVGTILGSLLGGTLSATCGIQCPVLVALVANLLGAALSVTYIPASTKGARAGPPGGPAARVFDLRAVSRLLLQPGVLPVFLVKVASGFPSGLFMVMFSIICMDFFRLDSAQAGYLMSAFGVLLMVIQGLVIGRLSSRFSEAALVRASVLVLSLVGLAMALMSTVFHFCLLMPGLVFGLCLLNVVTDSMLTKAVSASDTGTMLGLCAAVQPLTRTLGPTLGGLLYRGFGVPAFGHVQLAVNLLVLLALCRQPTPRKADKVR
ncbi:solute carrier family 22 member 18 isoform X2 [Pipistrellus kuhlii]|uniref:Organic cation transporter-like protein 2 n=1 Tax=Pipistrellus kuhlii TaxID=59472 RepID=A0A7J7R821_PIPKU|nr:solute carrier family 22 member 18 isoform X2 [Pipistrellus kuhlii]KAF6272252.1 solute carrier family 22 member 18 [Pipistrellus kuhlii]